MGNGHESLFAGADGDCGGSVKMDDTLDVGSERVQGRMNGVPLGGKRENITYFTLLSANQYN